MTKFWSTHYRGTEHVSDCLMTQADTKQWHSTSSGANQITRYAGIFGSAWSGRNDDRIDTHLQKFFDVVRVVSHHHRRTAQLPEILHEVVDETVVVVHHQHATRIHPSSLPTLVRVCTSRIPLH